MRREHVVGGSGRGLHLDPRKLDNDACNLPCQNGGHCTFVRDDYEGNEPTTATTSSSWIVQDGMFCECASNFTGAICEYEAEICGVGDDKGKHICLHGSKCILDGGGGIDDDGKIGDDGGGGGVDDPSYRCECDVTNPESCRQRHRTQFCTPRNHPEYAQGMAIPAFCLNDGKCIDIVEGDEV